MTSLDIVSSTGARQAAEARQIDAQGQAVLAYLRLRDAIGTLDPRQISKEIQ